MRRGARSNWLFWSATMLAGFSACRLDTAPEAGRTGSESLTSPLEWSPALADGAIAGASGGDASSEPPCDPLGMPPGEDPPPAMPAEAGAPEPPTCEHENPNCDDADPCTVDSPVIDAAGCSVECLHTPIEGAQGGDGCCPPGADFELDSDCARPGCGNQQLETGEECDGGGACTSTCAAMPGLIHRYGFNGKGTTARDSVGTADGRLVNTSLQGWGEANLRGESGDQYVELPAELVSKLRDASLEAWVTWHSGEPVEWQRVFDFGSSAADKGPEGDGESYLFMAVANENGSPRLTYKGVGDKQEVQVTASQPFPINKPVHVVSVFDDGNDWLLLYIDGALVNRAATGASLSGIRDVHNWLGRSQFAGDHKFNGRLDEFRIYDRALSANEVQQHFSQGPNP